MGKTKYQSSWKNAYPWVRECKRSIYLAYCSFCSKEINVSAGVTQLKLHQETKKHSDNEKSARNQATFTKNQDSLSLISMGKQCILSSEDQVIRAEILRCLDIIESNSSFSAANSDNDKYKLMFPDSKIASSYGQKADKVKYMIQFGIAPYLQKIILNELKELPFSFRFDETTTSQVKKQYDAYATYHSVHFKQIITSYLGTLFVGRCTANDLLQYTTDLLTKVKLVPENIISLGMDGPSVNKLFKEKFESDLQKRGHSIIDVGSCPLHTVSNGFSVGLKSIDEVDLDQFAVDLHSFFKFSAKRIEEYFDVEKFTEVYGQRMLRHVSTRWISLQDVLVRIMEQFTNLREYFLKFLPTQKGFNGKSGIAASERYIRIKNALTNKMLPSIAYSVIFIAQDYKAFTVALQSKQPMITCLFTKMQKLLKELLSKFVDDGAYLKSNKQLKPISKLKALDLNDVKIQKVNRTIIIILFQIMPMSLFYIQLLFT